MRYLMLIGLSDTIRVSQLNQPTQPTEGAHMRPSNRKPVNKGRSAAKFRAHTSRTKAPNVFAGPMRGGIRL